MEENPITKAIELSLLKKNKKGLEEEVKKILFFVQDVQSIDTNVKSERFGRINVFRKDTISVISGKYKEKFLSLAPRTFKDWFVSKKIL